MQKFVLIGSLETLIPKPVMLVQIHALAVTPWKNAQAVTMVGNLPLKTSVKSAPSSNVSPARTTNAPNVM